MLYIFPNVFFCCVLTTPSIGVMAKTNRNKKLNNKKALKIRKTGIIQSRLFSGMLRGYDLKENPGKPRSGS